MHKLKALDITGKLGVWFYNFLTHRTHCVRLPGAVSQDHPVLSGVPQGTVLGPLLFLITIADINKDISNSIDCDSLQCDLNVIYKWAIDNNMFFNAQKCHYLCFNPSISSNKCNVYIYPKYDITPHSENVLDLGITMSSNCSFDAHINQLSKKCKNLAGWILRTFITRDRLTMITLFKAIVLSRLDYASQLGSPSKIYQINLIEKVQRSFTKHITGMHDLSYNERLKALKLYSLQRRRERYCIIYVWKVLEGLVPNFSHPIIATLADRGRSCTISNVNVGRKGTLAFNSFRWQSIRMFNGLPKCLRNITLCSVNSFKTQLDSHLIKIRTYHLYQETATAWTVATALNGGHSVTT